MSRDYELTVDRIKCDGRGVCAQVVPELVKLDDWGYPIVASGGIPDHLRALADRAVEDCPVLALAIKRAEARRTPGR